MPQRRRFSRQRCCTHGGMRTGRIRSGFESFSAGAISSSNSSSRYCAQRPLAAITDPSLALGKDRELNSGDQEKRWRPWSPIRPER